MGKNFQILSFSKKYTGTAMKKTLDIITVEQDQRSKKMLTSVAKQVVFPLSVENQNIIAAMKKKLSELGGVGLAAPQVNYSLSIIAVYIPEQAKLMRDNVIEYPMHVLINPSYLGVEDDGKEQDFEACYSVASKAGKVLRYKTIKLLYQDEQGTEYTTIETGFYARVLQHEIDHINGILITDRLTPECQQGPVAEMLKIREQELPTDRQEAFRKMLKNKIK